MKKALPVIAGSVAVTGLILKEIVLHETFQMITGKKNSILGKKLFNRSDKRVPSEEEKWLLNQESETVSITSFDGLKLVGHYLPAKSKTPKRILLMMHGWRGTWAKDFGIMAKHLHERDCDLLIIEERAQGESEGRYMGFGILESRDCLRWLAYLRQRNKDKLPVYLAGVSMGASTVLMASGRGLPYAVKGIIADCGFTSPYEIIIHVSQRCGRKLPRLIKMVDRRCSLIAKYRFNDFSAVEAVKKCQVPVFFAHGMKDTFVPYYMTLENYEACRSRKTLYLVEDANHCECFGKNPYKYMERMWNFFGWD
ncbi:MAG: alpha/beta hydrolase [Butyrivibrio sp.]